MTTSPPRLPPAARATRATRTTSRRVIVVGSGIAGLTAARTAALHPGTRVVLVTKTELSESNTRYAQGGIAGVMSPTDRVADHIHDTMVAGAWLNDAAAVGVLAAEGPDRIRDLMRLGVAFDRDAAGELAGGLEAAHSYPRILHAGGDATGEVIAHALIAGLPCPDVEVVEHACLVDLVVHEGRAVGVELLLECGAHQVLEADAVVLATGGAGRLYAHTTNPPVATADGLAAAMRAGARVADLEFVQFHPTVLAVGEPFLVSEAVRGEGAVLLDEDGRRFAFDAHPDGELAPRDVLARAIATRMAEQGGRPVRLDATALGRAFLTTRFPTIDAAVRARGLDWAAEPILVTPAAHYLMGGVVTDLDGRTSIPGLYAAGEVAHTGVHGANRLASNSLLEGAVFGVRAGSAAAREPLDPDRVRRASDEASHPRAHRLPGSSPRRTGPERVAPFSRAALQRLMWQEAGLVRDEAGLARAAAQLRAWRAEAAAPTTVAEHEDANLLRVGIAVVDAALARTESIGAHYRSDARNARHGTRRMARPSAVPRQSHPAPRQSHPAPRDAPRIETPPTLDRLEPTR